jgi:hypothetical protein
MTPQKIMNGMREKNQELSMKNDEYIRLNDAMAQAEQNYNIAYAEKLLKLKMDGEPVTTAKDLAKGDKEVAKLRYAYVGAEGAFNACRERIKDLRSAIETYRSLLSWMKAEMEMAGKIPEK